MGALAALILPAFSDSESAAKDTACDYNQAGTLRYLNMFRGANGVYPSGFHTGLQASSAATIMTNLTTAATHNFGTASTGLQLNATTLESLQKAGIVQLAYGTDLAEDAAADKYVLQVNATGSYWTEDVDAVTGKINTAITGDDAAEALNYRGVSLSAIAQAGQAANVAAVTDTTAAKFRTNDGTDFTEPAFVIVPVFVAPTIDWETYYSDGPNESKISIAQAGKCPWGDDGTCRYYIAFFKVYTATEDGTADTEVPAAKLLCTSCPDCGILEGDLF